MHAVIDLQTESKDDASARKRAMLKRVGRSKPIAQRLRIIRELRHLIADQCRSPRQAAAAVRMIDRSPRSSSPKFSRWPMPVAGWKKARRACSRRVATGRRGRPFWMNGVSFEVQRQPFGLVLVIGPGNYPLFLPAVHSLHALAAGNAVLLKPAPGTRECRARFRKLAQRCRS